MAKEKLTKEKLDALKEMKDKVNNPGLESKDVPIIKNSYGAKDKIIDQYKIALPKKFVDFLRLNKDSYGAKATLDKKQNKIIIEVRKND